MASAPSEPRAIAGRVDRHSRLVSADPELVALQLEAGSSLGATLALPQVAGIAELARKLGIPVSRPAIAAGSGQDVAMWVRATPHGDDVVLALENWTVRPAAPPRLAALLGGDDGSEAAAEPSEWAADAELRLTALSPTLAERLGAVVADIIGQPLTRLFRLEENDAGEMPLLAAVATRQGFSGQTARLRHGDATQLSLSGEVAFTADGSFAGFSGQAVVEGAEPPTPAQHGRFVIDRALDEALRTPLDRIVDAAESIAERAHGPLRSDYTAYANDIAAAARHLLSVIHAMSEEPGSGHAPIDLPTLAAEAIILVESAAQARNVRIVLSASRPLAASGEERAVIQILVNLIGNAVRHSREGGVVTLRFARDRDLASVTVADEGPGIAPADQQRIFERFERADPTAGGTGLGLAISRRLARSMSGDIGLESAPDQGARFTLTLPAA